MKAIAKEVDWTAVPINVQPFVRRGQIFVTPGRTYDVHAVSCYQQVLFLLVVDDGGTPVFLPQWLFAMVTNTVPSDWICNVSLGHSLAFVLGPEFIAKSIDSYNAVVDQERDQIARVWRYARTHRNEQRLGSFEDLEGLLRNWRLWASDEGPYDVGGMMCLLGACLDNLRECALEAELEDIAEFLTPEQGDFLCALAARLRLNIE
jgi:hypothetical protein